MSMKFKDLEPHAWFIILNGQERPELYTKLNDESAARHDHDGVLEVPCGADLPVARLVSADEPAVEFDRNVERVWITTQIGSILERLNRLEKSGDSDETDTEQYPTLFVAGPADGQRVEDPLTNEFFWEAWDHPEGSVTYRRVTIDTDTDNELVFYVPAAMDRWEAVATLLAGYDKYRAPEDV